MELLTEQDYIAALDIVRKYEAQVKDKTQQTLNSIINDLNDYFNETDQKSMLDFNLSINLKGAIRITFRGIETEILTGEEPFLEKLEEIGRKHGVLLHVPFFYFIK